MVKSRSGSRNLYYAGGAAVVAAIAIVAVLGLSGGDGGGRGFSPDPGFDPAPVRARIEDLPDRGREHVTTRVDYGEAFPASGDHAPQPVPPGFYEDPIITEALVHSLEHGNIVIYYDTPERAALDQIREWTVRYQGDWDGIVAVPHQGLGDDVVLTAWTKRLRLDEFSADAAWVFIDAYRGRGPENPVR